MASAACNERSNYFMRSSPHRFPKATKSPRLSSLTRSLILSSKATTRSAAPPLLASHTRKVLSSDPLASRVSPVAGSAKAVSALTWVVAG